MRVFVNEIAMVGGLYALIKATAFVTAERRPAGQALAAYLAWPGVNPAPFTRTRNADTEVDPTGVPTAARRWVARGALVMAAGFAGVAALVVAAPRLNRAAVGWLGVAVILTTVHLGASDVLSGWRVRRYPVSRLFADPLASRSLREFWTVRWNTAYVEMNRVVFAPLARRWFGRYANAALFALSGLLHEAAISVPVVAGFGGPTTYFLLHAAAVHAEPRIGLAHWPRPLARLWTWCWILLPLPLLFHTPFRDGLVAALFIHWSTP
jgi:alginate O-acetyltransferase complex protein AlgI